MVQAEPKAPRDLYTVIRCMLLFVPTKQLSLRNGLSKVMRDSCYTAPELMRDRWFELGLVLNDHIQVPEVPNEFQEWERQVLAVFSDTLLADVSAAEAHRRIASRNTK